MQKIPVVKMSGTGNDFLMIDNRNKGLSDSDLTTLAQDSCTRRVSAGADGLIVVEDAKESSHDYRMRIINADGSEAEMCGNGSRCAAVFAKDIGAAGDDQQVETIAGTLHAVVQAEDSARVRLSPPTELATHSGLDLNGESADLYWMDTGVPHAIRFVDDVKAIDIDKEGAAIRRHPAFGERGTNANFVQLLGNNEIRVRTFERGVEGETLACGTGAAACAIISGLVHGYESPVKVHVASGDTLTILFTKKDATHAEEPYLEGAVRTVYAGEYFWNNNGS